MMPFNSAPVMGVLKYQSGIYMYHGGFKNRGLRERSLTENVGGWGFRDWPTREKEGFEAKTIKETYIVLERRIFSSCKGRKSGVFRSCQGQRMRGWGGGFMGAHTHTVPIWEYPRTATAG